MRHLPLLVVATLMSLSVCAGAQTHQPETSPTVAQPSVSVPPAQAQPAPQLPVTPPVALTLSTDLVGRMATQLQAMSVYMGGSAQRETAPILRDLQAAALSQPAAKPADKTP